MYAPVILLSRFLRMFFDNAIGETRLLCFFDAAAIDAVGDETEASGCQFFFFDRINDGLEGRAVR